jgi:hypothetical protein
VPRFEFSALWLAHRGALVSALDDLQTGAALTPDRKTPNQRLNSVIQCTAAQRAFALDINGLVLRLSETRPNRVWQFERPCPFSGVREKERRDALLHEKHGESGQTEIRHDDFAAPPLASIRKRGADRLQAREKRRQNLHP